MAGRALLNTTLGPSLPNMTLRHLLAVPCERLFRCRCLVQLDLKDLGDHRRSVGQSWLKNSIVERNVDNWICCVIERGESAPLKSTSSFTTSSFMQLCRLESFTRKETSSPCPIRGGLPKSVSGELPAFLRQSSDN